MIHTILEWKKDPEVPAADDMEPDTKLESLYLPAVDEPSAQSSESEQDQEGEMAHEEEEDGSVTEQDRGDSDEEAGDDDELSVEHNDEDERLGCVKVIENIEFDFDPAAEAEENTAGSRNQPLLGLVLTPTRELAVQVKHHIDAVAKFTSKSFL